jgi:O-succinylbenzoate synthase
MDGASVGYGEVAPLPEFGSETLEEARLGLLDLAAHPEAALRNGLPCCAFGLSAALENLKEQGWKAAQNYAVAGLLPAGEAAVAALNEKSKSGYGSFKWKVGVHDASFEQAIFDALVAQLPQRGRLRLDANGAWSPETLGSWLDFLKPRKEQVEFIEQPLAVGAEAAMLLARAESGIEIALDESLNGSDGARWLAEWPGVLVVKAALMGERGSLIELLGPRAGRVVLSSVFETGIGFLNTLSLADALPDLKLALGFDTLHFSDGLCGRNASAAISGATRATIDPDAIWRRNDHLN